MSVESQLMEIYTREGVLTPQLVVEEARDPASPLHDRFEWDDTAAGERYRQHQARQLIRTVRVTYGDDYDGSPRTVRRFHSVHRPLEERRSYEPVDSITQDPLMAKLLLQEMRREWLAMRRRYEHMNEFWELTQEGRRAEITNGD